MGVEIWSKIGTIFRRWLGQNYTAFPLKHALWTEPIELTVLERKQLKTREPMDHPRGPNHALCWGSGVPTHDNFWGGNGDENNGTVCWVFFLDHRGKLTQLPFWLTLQGAKIFSNVANGEIIFNSKGSGEGKGYVLGTPRRWSCQLGGLQWRPEWSFPWLPPKKNWIGCSFRMKMIMNEHERTMRR